MATRTKKASKLTSQALRGFQSAIDDLHQASFLLDDEAALAVARHDDLIVQAADQLGVAEAANEASVAARNQAAALSGLLGI